VALLKMLAAAAAASVVLAPAATGQDPGGTASAATPTRLFMYANLRDQAGQGIDMTPLIRPRALGLGPYGEHSNVRRLHWRHWGAHRAVAHGHGERCFNMAGCDTGRVVVRLSRAGRVSGCEDGGPRFRVFGRLVVTWRNNTVGHSLGVPRTREYPVPGPNGGVYC
jgi:hypothetical protein